MNYKIQIVNFIKIKVQRMYNMKAGKISRVIDQVNLDNQNNPKKVNFLILYHNVSR